MMDADKGLLDTKAIMSTFNENLKKLQLEFSTASVKPKTPVLVEHGINDIASSCASMSDCSAEQSFQTEKETIKTKKSKKKRKIKDTSFDTSMESNADSTLKTTFKLIASDVTVMKKEIEDTRTAVADTMAKMHEMMTEMMVSMIHKISTDFEEKMNDMLKKYQKQDDHILTIEKEASKHTKSVERVFEKANCVESDLKKVTEREKELRRRVIMMEASERKDNLMFFGIPEDEQKTCEESLHEFMRDKMNIATPCFLRNSKRLGNTKEGSTRPIVTSFVDRKERLEVWEKRFSIEKPFGVSNDLPREIRQARSSLVPQMKQLKHQGGKSFIAFPAILISNNKVIKRIDIAEVVLN